MVSSRLGPDPHGRLVAIVTVRTLPDVRAGHTYLVLGDSIHAAGVGIYFMCDDTRRASRPASARERQEAQRHAPYRPALSRAERERQDVPDEQLAEPAAIELASREQQRTPADLIGRAA